ncbi:Ig-like domain-containing protein [bacterium]|nr:Ig-like domain-containing protein [candidate division CSSED10-310 bacterium]
MKWMTVNVCLVLALGMILVGCEDKIENSFDQDKNTILVAPEIVASNLNFPWGIEFIAGKDSDGSGQGSVLSVGNLLVANRGTIGEFANTITQVNPHSGNIDIYSHGGLTDQFGLPAVSNPYDVAFLGPFVWIANDDQGLGSIAVTDPNPTKEPNGHSGKAGEPVPGPAGSGIFGMTDYGFIVTSVTPEDGAEGVSHHPVIAVEFSSPVDPSTVTSSTFEVQVDYSPQSPYPKAPTGSFSFSNDYKRVEFVYSSDLTEKTRYEIVLDKDITDQDGVSLDGDLRSPGPDDFNSIFTVGYGSPRVVWVRPADGSTFVSVDTLIEIGFSEPVKASTVSTTAFLVMEPDGNKISGDIHVDTGLMMATFVPREQLQADITYTVEVNYRVQDLTGNPLDQIPGGLPDAFVSHFSTGASSTQPPQVASASISGDLLTIIFTKEIDPSSLTGVYLSVVDSQNRQVSGTITWPSGVQMNFSASTGFSEGYYTVCVEDTLTDLQGVTLDGDGDGLPGGRYCTQVAAGGDRLYVTSSYPESGDTGISINTQIYMNFSKQVNSSTVTSASVYLVPVAFPDDHVLSVITLNPGNTSISLSPETDLDEDTDYRLTVTTDVTDLAGNSLDQTQGLPLDPFIAEFRTGGDDRTPPCVFESDPTDGDQNVSVNTGVTIHFTEAILPSTVNTTSFLMVGPDGAVTGNFMFTSGNTVVLFQPGDRLASEETYTVTLTSAITDTSGHGLDGDCDGSTGPDFEINFTTGLGKIVINEVVVDPQQDWNDSEGGDGIPFSDTPGSGAITTSDEWIELYNTSGQTLDLTGWTLEMIDTTPETHVIGSGSGTEIVYPTSASVTNFLPGSYLVVGNPVGSNNNDCYFILRDTASSIIDDVEIGDDPAGDGDGNGAPEPGENGDADSIANESVARVPNGIDTDNHAEDFAQQSSTLGADNGGARGFGTYAGYWGAGVGLVGISGIVDAGLAPDDPSYMSRLIFASHSDRGLVYGIDLDDGPYVAFTGVDTPMGIEFVPLSEDADPGSGYLFITDPEAGNITRVRMKPSGPVGTSETLSVVDGSGLQSVVCFTYAYLNNPIGIAYSVKYDHLYVACRGNGFVLEITRDGELKNTYDTGLGVDALGGIDIGEMGDEEVVFLSHTGGERVDTGDGNKGAVLYFDPHP